MLKIDYTVEKLSGQLSKFNYMFSNLLHRKNQILARLKGVQIGLSNQPNEFLVCIDKELHAELAEVSALEGEYWAMKSHITWLVEGDRNTASIIHLLWFVATKTVSPV